MITARIGQAETQPDHRCETLDDEGTREPVDDVFHRSRAQADSREYTINTESRHPTEEAPCSRRRLPAKQAHDAQKQAEKPSRERKEEKAGHRCSGLRNNDINKNKGIKDSTKKIG